MLQTSYGTLSVYDTAYLCITYHQHLDSLSLLVCCLGVSRALLSSRLAQSNQVDNQSLNRSKTDFSISIQNGIKNFAQMYFHTFQGLLSFMSGFAITWRTFRC